MVIINAIEVCILNGRQDGVACRTDEGADLHQMRCSQLTKEAKRRTGLGSLLQLWQCLPVKIPILAAL